MDNLIVTMSDTAPRFAVHELAYLLATRTDASAETSRLWLGIPSVEQDREAAELGLSSLVARGLIGEADGNILPLNEAGLVGFALGTATKWITITLRLGDQVDLVRFIQGAGIAIMARHAPAQTIDFFPIKHNYDADVAAIASVDHVLGMDSDLALLIRSATLDGERGLFARNESMAGWGIGFDPVFPGDDSWPAPEMELKPSSRSDILGAAARLIRHGQGEP